MSEYLSGIYDYRESMPQMFKHLPLDPRKVRAEDRAAWTRYNDNLTPNDYQIIRTLAAENPTFEAALIARGLAYRGTGKRTSKGVTEAGLLHMPEAPISMQELAEVLGIVALRNADALEGAPAWMKDLTLLDGYTQEALAGKTSRVPREVRAIGRALERSENLKKIQAYVPESMHPFPRVPRDWSVAKTAAVAAIRPESYQIQSLTYEDFMAGKS